MTKLSYILAVVPLLFLLHSLTVVAEKDFWAQQKAINDSSWLKNHTTNWRRPRPPGCWSMPWICRQGTPPMARMRCCQNQCVDVLSDVNHCRFCNRRCPFTWQCCDGQCVNTNTDPFNCGRCCHICPFGAPCEFGMCGYAQPVPPWPPRPPKPWPRPPKPWPWPQPRPPKWPKPPPPFNNNGDSHYE